MSALPVPFVALLIGLLLGASWAKTLARKEP